MTKNWHTAANQEAFRLFRKVHGPGDSGSEFAFLAQNLEIQSGWLRLAAETISLCDALKDLADEASASIKTGSSLSHDFVDQARKALSLTEKP